MSMPSLQEVNIPEVYTRCCFDRQSSSKIEKVHFENLIVIISSSENHHAPASFAFHLMAGTHLQVPHGSWRHSRLASKARLVLYSIPPFRLNPISPPVEHRRSSDHHTPLNDSPVSYLLPTQPSRSSQKTLTTGVGLFLQTSSVVDYQRQSTFKSSKQSLLSPSTSSTQGTQSTSSILASNA
jgi:hypothetical protein